MDEMELLEVKRFRDWILEAIDQIRNRKARPNLERICRLVQKNHPELPFQVAKVVLWKLVKTGDVLKMEYKGNTSYRNPSKMNRKYGKTKSRSIDIETFSQSDDIHYHSTINENLKHSKRKRTRTPFCLCCFGENCTSEDSNMKQKKTIHALIEDNQKGRLLPEYSKQPIEATPIIPEKGQCENAHYSNQHDTDNINVRTVSVCMRCKKTYCLLNPNPENINGSEYFCDHCKSVDGMQTICDDGDRHFFHLLSPNSAILQEREPASSSPASDCDAFNSSNETGSEETIHPKDWSVDDVQKFIERIGFCAEAELFRKQEVDGLSLLLMKRNDVLSNLNLRLGPALKIYQHIANLQKSSYLINF